MSFNMGAIRHLVDDQAFVLVTNATQPIALQTIKQLLELGCRVRAAHNDGEGGSWLDDLFAPYRASGKFERVTLQGYPKDKDYPRDKGYPKDRRYYQDAVRGTTAIVHTCIIVPHFDAPLSEIRAVAQDSVRWMLEAAEFSRTVKSFVYTSSFRAATELVPKNNTLVREDSWNSEDTVSALTARHSGNFDVIRNMALTYAEEALWQWQAEQWPDGGPHFKINAVSPSNIIGQNFGAGYTNRWKNWIWRVYESGRPYQVVRGAGPTQRHWYVDVEDVALMHVAALFDAEIASLRLQVWGHHRDCNDVIEVMEEVDPEGRDRRPFVDDDGMKRGELSPHAPEVYDILRRWKGIEGTTPCWKPFKQTIVESVELYHRMDRIEKGKAVELEKALAEKAPTVNGTSVVLMASRDYCAKHWHTGHGQASSSNGVGPSSGTATPKTPVH